MRTAYILITNFQKRKFWTRKFWQFSYNLPNSPKFSPSKILYRMVAVEVVGEVGEPWVGHETLEWRNLIKYPSLKFLIFFSC